MRACQIMTSNIRHEKRLNTKIFFQGISENIPHYYIQCVDKMIIFNKWTNIDRKGIGLRFDILPYEGDKDQDKIYWVLESTD